MADHQALKKICDECPKRKNATTYTDGELEDHKIKCHRPSSTKTKTNASSTLGQNKIFVQTPSPVQKELDKKKGKKDKEERKLAEAARAREAQFN